MFELTRECSNPRNKSISASCYLLIVHIGSGEFETGSQGAGPSVFQALAFHEFQ